MCLLVSSPVSAATGPLPVPPPRDADEDRPVSDSAWQAMLERDVQVGTSTKTFHGRLAGHDDKTVTVIEQGGDVTIIPKDEVLVLRAQDSAGQSLSNAPPSENNISRGWEKRAVTQTVLGASFSTVGIIGLVLFSVGWKDGRVAQQKVEDPSITGEEFDYWNMRGRRANAMTYTGAIVASRLIGGIIMLSMGIAWRPRPNKRTTMTHVVPLVSPSLLAGVGLTHRF